MMHGHQGASRPWSKEVSFLLRLCAMSLAFASGIVMAASTDCIPSSGAATFTYTRFGTFVFFVVCSITAAILEVAAIYICLLLDLAAAAAANKTVTEKEEEEEQVIRTAGIVLGVVDFFVPVLLLSAMVAVYVAGEVYSDQIRGCGLFARQVTQAKILSAAACVAISLASTVKDLPL